MTTNLFDDARHLAEAGKPSGGLPPPASALTIGAHPDDAEFGAGGTLARWCDAGTDVTILVVTDGSKGSWDVDADRAALVASRRAEQQAAAAVIGAAEVVHLDHVDGELENTMDLRAELCRWIRTVRPQVLFTHDPWRRYLLHPDHRVTGLTAIDAVVAARDHLFFPEQGLDKHRPDALLLWQPEEIDHVEDISDHLERKVEALLCHSSQSETTLAGAAGSAEAREAFSGHVQAVAASYGSDAGLAAAEGFKLLRP